MAKACSSLLFTSIIVQKSTSATIALDHMLHYYNEYGHCRSTYYSPKMSMRFFSILNKYIKKICL